MIAMHNSGKPKASLALGGGGARGLAHLGAVQAVRESDIVIERIVGVSIGSLAGAMLALDENSRRVQARVLDYLASDDFRVKQESLFGTRSIKASSKPNSGLLAWYDQIKSYLWARHLLGRVFRRRSLLSGGVLEAVIAQLVPDIDIAESPIPLSVVAVDLRQGIPVVLERGSLRRAIAASAAIPGIFPPVPWDEMLLCDLGVLDSLPTTVAESYGSELVIGVDVGPEMDLATHCDSALHVLLRMDEIGERLVRRHSQARADVLIQPPVGMCPWFAFSEPEWLITAGYRSGQQALAQWRRQHETTCSQVSLPYVPNCAAVNTLSR